MTIVTGVLDSEGSTEIIAAVANKCIIIKSYRLQLESDVEPNIVLVKTGDFGSPEVSSTINRHYFCVEGDVVSVDYGDYPYPVAENTAVGLDLTCSDSPDSPPGAIAYVFDYDLLPDKDYAMALFRYKRRKYIID